MSTSTQSLRTDKVPLEDRIRNAEAAVAKYGNPSAELNLIGITGTNGKSTTAHIVRALLDSPKDGIYAASIGTLGILTGANGEVVPGGLGLTTPGPEELQRVLRDLVDRGINTVVMEVSSHALDQARIHGVQFNCVAFTNLTRDHLDYHESMEKYFAAKSTLLKYVKPDGVVVINSDDPVWQGLDWKGRTITYSVGEATDPADLYATDVVNTSRGSEWALVWNGDKHGVKLPLIGDFNISNSLCAAALALGTGLGVKEIAARLNNIPQVPGRLEVISEAPIVLRDYAHTPDALQRALSAVRVVAPAKVIVVFGAGGDRDTGKRPIMGSVAENFADFSVVTSDNPRTEDPQSIVDQILAGMNKKTHIAILDRREAIRYAIESANTDDIVLLAGKGHETYQILGQERLSFDEKEVVQSIISEL